MRLRNPRRSAAAAAVAVGALTLAGCGPTVGGGSASAEDDAQKTDWSSIEPAKKISFLTTHPGGSIDIEEEIVANFKEETGITVELITGGSYPESYQKFATSQTGSDVPDMVILADVTWFSAHLADTIIPVDDIMAGAGIDMSTYREGFYEDYLYDNVHWAVPYARSTPIYYYNKDHYAAAGLGEEGPTTWEEVKEFSTKLMDAPSDVAFGLPEQANYPAWILSNPLWGNGGDWSDEWDLEPMTAEPTVTTMQFMQDGINDGWAKVVESIDTAFSAGAISQFAGTTGQLKGTLENATFDVGVAPLPLGSADTDKVVPTGGAGIAIAKKASPENQLAAAMFIGYLTNAENSAKFSAGTGYMPVQKDADMSETYAQYPEFEIAVNQLDRTRPQNYVRVLLPGGDIALSEHLNNILTANADVKTELEAAKAELQSIYDRDVKDRLEELSSEG